MLSGLEGHTRQLATIHDCSNVSHALFPHSMGLRHLIQLTRSLQGSLALDSMARFLPLLLVVALLASALPVRGEDEDLATEIIADATAQMQDAMAHAASTVVSSSSSATSSGTSSGSTTSSASAMVGGVPESSCGVLSETSSDSCTNSQCCKVAQRVTACKGFMTAEAEVNGAPATCCVVLLDTKYKNNPKLFGGAPYKKGKWGRGKGGAVGRREGVCGWGVDSCERSVIEHTRVRHSSHHSRTTVGARRCEGGACLL